MKRVFLLSIVLCLVRFGCAQNVDINLAKDINKWEIHGFSNGLSVSAMVLGAGVPLTMGIYGIAAHHEDALKNAIYIGSSVAEAVAISYTLKFMVDRDRPFVKYPNDITPYHAPNPDSPSFPSAHAATAFSLATSISLTYPKWYVIAPAATWACGVSIARINQGAHYPSDVATGAVIGIGCAFANVYLNRWLNKVLLDKKVYNKPYFK